MAYYDSIDDNILIDTACRFEFNNEYIKKLED